VRSDAFRAGEDVTTGFIVAHFPDNAARAAAPDATAWAIAAWLSAVAAPARATVPAPWRDWASTAPAPLRWKLAAGETTREGRVFAHPYGARVTESDAAVEIVGAAGEPGVAFDVRVDGAGARVVYAWRDGVLWLSCGGDHAFTDLRLQPPARDVKAEAGAVAARMNGKIVAVLVKAGDVVVAGAPLVTLEAMKMEHVMAAPAAARVKAVHVAPGEQVAPGRLLVELEP
jgi:geranyl-CoA carboxylase alpha subunit